MFWKFIAKKLAPFGKQVVISLVILALFTWGAGAIRRGIDSWNSSELKSQLINAANSDVNGEELRLIDEPMPTSASFQKGLNPQTLPATLVAAAAEESTPAPESTPGVPDSVLAIGNLKQQLEKNEWPDLANPEFTFSVDGQQVDFIEWLTLWGNKSLVEWGKALIANNWDLGEEMAVQASLEQRELGTLPLQITNALETAAPTWSDQQETSVSLPAVTYRAPAYSAAAQAQATQNTETGKVRSPQPASAVNIVITAMSNGDSIKAEVVGTSGVLVGDQLLEKGSEVAVIPGSGETKLRYCVDCGTNEQGEPIRLALVPEVRPTLTLAQLCELDCTQPGCSCSGN